MIDAKEASIKRYITDYDLLTTLASIGLNNMVELSNYLNSAQNAEQFTNIVDQTLLTTALDQWRYDFTGTEPSGTEEVEENEEAHPTL